jgi:hypothetical protein
MKLPYRIASLVLALFAAGHTYGFLKFTPPTAEGLAVRDAMNQVHFPVKGSDFSYGGFYLGFGLFVTAYLFYSAILAWQLGSLAERDPRTARSLTWSLFTVQLVSLALSLMFFAAPPALLSAIVAACLAWGALRSPSAQATFAPAYAAPE